MVDMRDYVEWLKEEQQGLRDRLAPLESGSMHIGRRAYGANQWEDLTGVEIERLKKSIAEYDALIAQYST